MAERERPHIEVDPRYSGSPESRDTYIGTYSDALNILADASMPDDIRARAGELAGLYAAVRAEKIIKLEEDTKALASRIRVAIPEIVAERGLSSDMAEGTLMHATLSPSSHNFQSLQIAERTGRLVELHRQREKHNSGRRSKMSAGLIHISDVPELCSGQTVEQYNSPNHPMFIFYIDLAYKLGFLGEEENWVESARVKKSGLIKDNAVVSITIPHSEYAYDISYMASTRYSYTPETGLDTTTKVPTHIIRVQSVDPFRRRG